MSKLSEPYNPSSSNYTTAGIGGPFVQYIGLQVHTVTGDRVEARWAAAAHLLQPYGILHGGVHCSVVETLASVGAATWLRESGRTDAKVVGVNNNTDFFRAVGDGELHSAATPLHRGRAQQLWVVETLDSDGRIIARGQVRLQNLDS